MSSAAESEWWFQEFQKDFDLVRADEASRRISKLVGREKRDEREKERERKEGNAVDAADRRRATI